MLTELAFDFRFDILWFPIEYIFAQINILDLIWLLFKQRFDFCKPELFHSFMYFLDQVNYETCEVVQYDKEDQSYEAPPTLVPPDSFMLFLPGITETIQGEDTC